MICLLLLNELCYNNKIITCHGSMIVGWTSKSILYLFKIVYISKMIPRSFNMYIMSFAYVLLFSMWDLHFICELIDLFNTAWDKINLFYTDWNNYRMHLCDGQLWKMPDEAKDQNNAPRIFAHLKIFQVYLQNLKFKILDVFKDFSTHYSFKKNIFLNYYLFFLSKVYTYFTSNISWS